MPDLDPEHELIRAHHAASDKYTYFLLAAAGACIAFSLTQTKDSRLSWAHVPLGLAVLSWAVSFWSGCLRIGAFTEHLRLNAVYLRVKLGRDEMIGQHTQLIQAASETTLKALDKVGNRNVRLVKAQFGFLIAGAVLYIVWHVLGMYLRRA